MTFSSTDPFFGDVPDTVPLKQSPLTGVLVQVKFPEILSISKAEFVAGFQEKIREKYPQHQREESVHIEMSANGAKQSQLPVWRFFDVDLQWRVTLSSNFISLETRAYKSRADFSSRIGELANALSDAIAPKLMTRIGIRYVDRIHGPQFEKLDQLVRPEILGIYSSSLKNQVERTISELQASTDVGPVSVRYGYMAPNQTHEVDLMPAISAPSWFLDIDAFREFQPPVDFSAHKIESLTHDLATRSHGFFRWAVSDEFLRSYGGDT